MRTIRRILGQRCRTTIPYEFRKVMGLEPEDVIEYQLVDYNTVVIQRRPLCDDCEGKYLYNEPKEEIMEIFDDLTVKEKFEVVSAITSEWAETIGGVDSNERPKNIVPIQP